MISSYGALLAHNNAQRLNERARLLDGDAPQIRGQRPTGGQQGIGHGGGLLGRMRSGIADLGQRFVNMLSRFTAKAVPISQRIAPELMRDVTAGRVGPLGRPVRDDAAMKELLHFAWNKRGDTTVESRVVIRSILTAFVAKGGSIEAGMQLKEQLKGMEPDDLDQMLADMNRPDRSNTRVLIDHGLAPARGTHIDGRRADWADEPDHRAFAYDRLGTSPRQVGGEGVIKDDSVDGAFCMFKTHDAGDWAPTGDKVHLSIRPDQLGRAWDTVLPILLAHPEVVKEFKIINPETTDAQLRELGDKVRNGTATEREQREHANLLRVTGGAQITIYMSRPQDGGGAPTGEFAQVMREIDQALRQENIAPGERPLGSDVPISEHLSYRSDRTTDGRYIAENDPGYEQHKATFTERPAYRALEQAFA